MIKLSKTLLIWTFILGACSSRISSPTTFPTSDNTTLTPLQPPITAPTTEIPLQPPTTDSSIPKFIVTVGTPHIDPGPNGEFPDTVTEVPSSVNECGYQWAYEDMPELTAQFDAAVQNLIPNSASHATAFGENCIGNDGQVIRFLAMETDFYVIFTTESVNDYETFGIWIAQVMQVVNALPQELIEGSKPGFVEFLFGKDLNNSIGVRVPIQQYNESANGKTGEELFRIFYAMP